MRVDISVKLNNFLVIPKYFNEIYEIIGIDEIKRIDRRKGKRKRVYNEQALKGRNIISRLPGRRKFGHESGHEHSVMNIRQ